MSNWMVGFRVRAFPGKGEELAKMLAEAPNLNMPGCLNFIVGRMDDTVFGYEEWISQEAWDGSLALEAVQDRLRKAIPLVMRGPEIVYQGFKVDPK